MHGQTIRRKTTPIHTISLGKIHIRTDDIQRRWSLPLFIVRWLFFFSSSPSDMFDTTSYHHHQSFSPGRSGQRTQQQEDDSKKVTSIPKSIQMVPLIPLPFVSNSPLENKMPLISHPDCLLLLLLLLSWYPGRCLLIV